MGVKFTERSAERIASAVQYVERRVVNQPGHRGRWGGRRGKKPFVRFTLDAALATSDASKAATITDQWGEGVTHNTATAITVYNVETSSAGTYIFEGDINDAGTAFWKGDPQNPNDYVIVNMECP